jgi:IS1 family transposase
MDFASDKLVFRWMKYGRLLEISLMKVWVWIAFDAHNQQVIDLHFGNRGYESALVPRALNS